MKKLMRFGVVFLAGVFLMYLFFPNAMNYSFNFSEHLKAASTLQVNFTDSDTGPLTYHISNGSKEWKALHNWFQDNTEKWQKRDPSELKDCEVEVKGGDLRIQFDYKGRRADVILRKDEELIAYTREIKPGELDFLLHGNP